MTNKDSNEQNLEATEQVILIHTNNIIIPEGRYRTDFGNLSELQESIKLTKKNVTPIQVREHGNGKYILIAGERRTRACKALGIPVRAVVETDEELDNQILEVIENLHRKDFTWQEKVKATEDLYKIIRAKEEFLGIKSATFREICADTNLSLGGLSINLNLAAALKETPEIFEGCKSKEQAMKALKKFQIDEMKTELALRKRKTNYGQQASSFIFHGDCNNLIDTLPERSIHALVSDPIFGIDVFNNRLENRDLPQAFHKETYDDTKENFFKTMEILITKSSKVLKENSCVLMFCGFQNAQWLMEQWTKEGYKMDVTPGIWVKAFNTARTNVPERFFNRCYEMFVYGTRGDYVLAKQGTTNVLNVSAIQTAERDHQAQKPVELMEQLLERLVLPGSIILDPMCGTGSTLIAAIKRACIPIGFELDKTFYDLALSKLATALELKDRGLSNEI